MGWYDIKSKVVSWAADIRIYPGGIILWGDSHYDIKGPQMRQILDNLQPGDILLRRYSHYLGSVTIPGYWSHVAMYVGGDYWVIHMLGEGIVKEDILTFMRCDDVCILRSKDESLIQPAIDKAWEQLEKGADYDYNFDDSEIDKFYCCELVEFCYGYPINPENARGIKAILPDAFMESDKFETIWQSEKAKSDWSKLNK
jgi:uncharacterized protein YycO